MILDSKYLIEIDVIFDTRLGVLASLDDETAASVMGNPKYVSRTQDEFYKNLPNVSETAYLNAYKQRDSKILNLSSPTHFVPVLKQMVLGDFRDPKFNFNSRKISIHINAFPYKFNEEEKKDIKAVIEQIIPGPFDVQIVYYPKTSISPMLIKANSYTTVAMYDLIDWLDKQQANFMECQVPETTLIGPELLKEIPDFSQVTPEFREKLQELGPFRAAEIAMIPYCNLFLMGASIFSSWFLPIPRNTA